MFGQHGGGGTNSGDETSAGFLVLEDIPNQRRLSHGIGTSQSSGQNHHIELIGGYLGQRGIRKYLHIPRAFHRLRIVQAGNGDLDLSERIVSI